MQKAHTSTDLILTVLLFLLLDFVWMFESSTEKYAENTFKITDSQWCHMAKLWKNLNIHKVIGGGVLCTSSKNKVW